MTTGRRVGTAGMPIHDPPDTCAVSPLFRDQHAVFNTQGSSSTAKLSRLRISEAKEHAKTQAEGENNEWRGRDIEKAKEVRLVALRKQKMHLGNLVLNCAEEERLVLPEPTQYRQRMRPYVAKGKNHLAFLCASHERRSAIARAIVERL